MSSKVLSATDILNTVEPELHRVNVPEWGGDVFIKEMSGKERGQFEGFVQNKIGDGKGEVDVAEIRVTLLSFSLVDDKGERLFKDTEKLAALNKKSGKVLARLGELAQDVNGMSKGSTAEMRKNS